MVHCFRTILISLLLGAALTPKASASLAGESPYVRLRAQFLKAVEPELSHFQPGKPWYCSSSLEAAKGQLRYVAIWEHRYLWVPGVSHRGLHNQHEFYPMSLSLDDASGGYVDFFLNEVTESFRVNEDGHFIVEVSSIDGFGMRSSKRVRHPSLVHDSLTAQNYFLCMNPEWQSNQDWEYDRSQIFGVDGNH